MSSPKLLPPELQRAMICAAKCDQVVTSEDWLRAFSYDESWSAGVSMAKYDNGGGDHIFAFFTSCGKTLIKGFDHESGVSPHAQEVYGIWPGMYDGLPPELLNLVEDDAIEHEHVTFCYWSLDGRTWKFGKALIPSDIDDGSTWLLGMVQMNADEFIEWGKSYYEEGFDRIGESGVLAAFKHRVPDRL